MDATASRPLDLRYSKLHFIPEFAFYKKNFELATIELNQIKNIIYPAANSATQICSSLYAQMAQSSNCPTHPSNGTR
jgi:hypothetical protein